MSEIRFQMLEESDLDQVVAWRMLPHVASAGDRLPGVEIRAKLLSRIDSDVVRPFLILEDDLPVGYIQYYRASEIGGWWPNADEKTVGFDLFIGEESALGRGLGKRVVAQFRDFVFEDPRLDQIVADPRPGNGRMIRCLEAAGFKNLGVIQSPEGMALLYWVERKPAEPL